ncbi:uncharacterized protein TRIADDRAFT_60587 [Trichoplax adhaerens]|uniref:Protein HEXIM1 n=1 Tax=Trichoplax adhaerens TaxID=10228 RepID=B3S8M1_TRIAD|nr:hypothetical protein TRIADDRAFT_60587 [Trichoplax adhaerens]EDV20910.1 hypothetical protein TRIADDRAFT_60587 [Trichoplax adhaerens]|eukprot:XP_002116554.1 hypothetical protein TRIADDRAFT_60587 [Trichoplax adhaerens]
MEENNQSDKAPQHGVKRPMTKPSHRKNRRKNREGKKLKYASCVIKKIPIDGVTNQQNNNSKDEIGGWKKTRRGKKKRGKNNKKKFSNYQNLSCQEKAELEEMAAEEATQLYNQRIQSGLPVTPFNTTQFIMDDYEKARARSVNDNSDDLLDEIQRMEDKSENGNYSGEDEFTAHLEEIRFDKYDRMSKGELVRYCYQLDKKIQQLEEADQDATNRDSNHHHHSNETKIGNDDVEQMQKEIASLRQENTKLYGLIASQKEKK